MRAFSAIIHCPLGTIQDAQLCQPIMRPTPGRPAGCTLRTHFPQCGVNWKIYTYECKDSLCIKKISGTRGGANCTSYTCKMWKKRAFFLMAPWTDGPRWFYLIISQLWNAYWRIYSVVLRWTCAFCGSPSLLWARGRSGCGRRRGQVTAAAGDWPAPRWGALPTR